MQSNEKRKRPTIVLLLLFLFSMISVVTPIYAENDPGFNFESPSTPPGSSGGGSGSDPGSGDGGGGGSESGTTQPGSGGEGESEDGEGDGENDNVDSEPSYAEIARAESLALEAHAASMGIDVSQLSQEMIESILDSTWESFGLNRADSDSQKAAAVGDPVLVTTGQYVLGIEDISIPGSGFSIARKYLSEAETVGSMGAGWLASVDSRLIRGVTRVNEEELSRIDMLVANILRNYHRIDKAYAADVAERLYRQIYLPAQAKLDELLAISARGQQLAALNRFSMFPESPGFFEGVGNDNLVIVDEDGVPKVFQPERTGAWLPVNYPERLYMRLQSVDGRGAESTAGFVLHDRGGRKKHYNGHGLLMAVEELNGNRVELIRDTQGRLVRIRGPHNNEWIVEYGGRFISAINGPCETEVRYGYSDNDLVWVRDWEGDTARFAYEQGRLTEIIKPDGSAIRLVYGFTGEGQRRLVSTTTHEEGDSEKFDYNLAQRLTTHTNHSGVMTRYWYDERHRTIREEHSNGNVRTFAYNNLGQLERETFNGFATRYSYDGRGNITEKVYSDGTRESWEWNRSGTAGNDLPLRYVDRDGIVTEWRYDNRWNCVEVRRGGEIVFTRSYDDHNRLIASREGDRAEIRYEYNDHDFISARTVTINGIEIREEWEIDALNRVLKYADGAGRVWEYLYARNEIMEKTPLGLERKLLYNNRKNLVLISERDMVTGETREQHRTFDKRRLLVEEKDGAGNVTRYQYRADGELVRMDRGPWFFEYDYDAGGRINTVTRGMGGSNVRHTETYRYELQGWEELLAVSQPLSGTTVYRFDAWRRVIGLTNALGESSIRTSNGAGNTLRAQGAYGGFFTYRYNAQGRMVEAGREGERAVQVRFNRDGSVAEMTDRLGNITRYVYDGRGLLFRELSALGEERCVYDAAGRLVRREASSRNGSFYFTEWIYDDTGRSVTITAGGLYTETLHLNAWGETVRRVDGLGNEHRFEYDGAGSLLRTIDSYGAATSYSWNELGEIELITHAGGVSASHKYDHLGNLTEVRDAAGISWAGEYDEAGRLAKETGRPGINREYKYDILGRMIEVRNGGEVTEQYRYTTRGREFVFTDGAGEDFRQQRNAFGELTSEVNRMGDTQHFAYDAEGRPISRTAFSGKLTKVEYRAAEGLTITTYSDGSQNIIERDLAGNILRATNETGTIRFRYDAGGRLVEQTDEGAGETTRYSYDRAGRRIRMQSGNRDVHYRYGRNGELLQVFDSSQRLDVRYEYDARGRETRRAYGNGVRQETFYDAIGRIIMIRELDSRGSLLRAESYLYDALGRRSHSIGEQGQVTKYEYDSQSRLSAVLYPWTREKAEADRKEAEKAGLFFTPDRGSGERHSFSATELNMLREALNQVGPARENAVTSSQMIWRETFAYDRNGNRAARTNPWGTIGYEYDAENRVTREGDIQHLNDQDGNLLSSRGLRYEASFRYNGHNRMIHFEVTNHVEKTHAMGFYDYDALGRRTAAGSLTGQVIRTLYDGRSFEVIREGETFRDGSLTTRFAPSGAAANAFSNQPSGERYRWIGDEDANTRTRSSDGYTVQGSKSGVRSVTLYGNGEALALGYSSSSASRSMYLGKDILGSVRSATLDTGSPEARYEYDVFGQPFSGDLSGMMNLGYMSKPLETVTGLYNYGFRDYKPRAARFTTVDPIRDGSNWFVYVNNDPVNWVDLWGLWSEVLGAIVNDRTVDGHAKGDGKIGNAEQYVWGKNDCDIWVESVLNQADIPLPAGWTPAAETKVAGNVANLKNELQSQPSPGANLVFHNNNHAMIGYLNADGTFQVAHNTSKPYNNVIPGGNSERATFSNVARFETAWNSANKPTHYVSLEQTTPPANPVSSAPSPAPHVSGSVTSFSGRTNPSAGKDK